MKKIIILLAWVIGFYIFSCNKEGSCKEKTSTVHLVQKLQDLNNSSLFFQDSVLYLNFQTDLSTYQGDCLRCCPSPKCENTSLEIENLSPKDIDLTITVSGKGNFTFSINKGETKTINPLPDYCTYNSWGSVKEIVYK
jgi:hypothetical protein